MMRRVGQPETQFAICIKNTGYRASLELRKLYPVLPDPRAWDYGQVRIVDESGEDYLYPREYFVFVKLPEKVEAALQLVS